MIHESSTSEVYTLSLHDALPICYPESAQLCGKCQTKAVVQMDGCMTCLNCGESRSEEHTSELQSRENLVCRLLLEKKKKLEQHVQVDTYLENYGFTVRRNGEHL